MSYNLQDGDHSELNIASFDGSPRLMYQSLCTYYVGPKKQIITYNDLLAYNISSLFYS